MPTATEVHPDVRIAELVARYKYDPLNYVRIAFPWKEKGTMLEGYDGPCPCQVRILTALRDEVQKRKFNGKDPVKPIRIAVASGHGIGKSACIGMIADWIRTCWPYSQGSATANTAKQLETKTWANIRKWQRLSLTSHWFEATSQLVFRHEERDTWFLSAQNCAEENSEAFAGQHAANSISYYINDECSGIPDTIFEVQDGGMTDGMPIQLLFGNPTKRDGKFARAMQKQEPGSWVLIRIDSRECPFTNKEEIKEWIDAYGEDSDFVRVRVLGLPPRAAADQFIPDDWVSEARERPVTSFNREPLICGVDFAWGGDDDNTIRFRKGNDARSIPPMRIPGEFTRDPAVMTLRLANVLGSTWNGDKVAMLFMDSAGIAGPVAAKLRDMGYRNLMEVNFGADAPDIKYANYRSFMWGSMKDWLRSGCIDKSKELMEDLAAPGYTLDRRTRLLLEPKDKIKERLLRSTDDGDALALTFAGKVAPIVSLGEDPRNRAYDPRDNVRQGEGWLLT